LPSASPEAATGIANPFIENHSEVRTMTDQVVATTEPARREAQAPETREEMRYRAPAVDIYEVENGLEVLVDLPGVDEQGVEIKVENGLLTIVGRAPATDEADYMEFRLCDFYRQFRLSQQVDQEKIGAELKHGVLRLRLPRAQAALPRQIPVNVN
jgi:HSP20 family molecular chaperone IbpA